MLSQNLKKLRALNNNPIIQVDNLNVYYNIPSANIFKKSTFHAVKDVSFKIFENTTIGLVGESGSGKSTLGKAIANLISYEGDVFFKGKELNSNSLKKERAKKEYPNSLSRSLWLTFTKNDNWRDSWRRARSSFQSYQKKKEN